MKTLFDKDWLRRALNRFGDDSDCQVGTDQMPNKFMQKYQKNLKEWREDNGDFQKPDGLMRTGFYH